MEKNDEVKKQEGQEQADGRQKGSPEQTLIEGLLARSNSFTRLTMLPTVQSMWGSD